MLFKFGGIFRNVWRGALLLGTLVIGANSLFVAPVSAAAGVNQQLNFQGRLLNAQGAVVVDGYYNVEFKIYQDGPGTAASNPGGTLKWTEDWLNSGGSPVKVVNGYMSVQLGSINPFGNSIDWNQDTIWLSINIGNTTSCTITTNFNANCGGDGEMLPMKRLSAVPYALNSAKLGGLTAAGFIQNTTTVQTATNMAIDGTARADTSILTPLVDTNSAVALNIGTTNATAINLNQNVTVAANKSLTLAGGSTANRPASPTEGMMWYDTTTKQLVVYSNGKWQADRNTSTKIVAASNASQALKDGADYVATGTGDQGVINSALTAAAGGKVYLTEGTFTIDGSISVPNNTTLAGAGAGTVITIPNSFNADINAVTNTTTGGNGTGITIQDIKLEGNKSNQTSGIMTGIYFNGVGSGSGASAITGGKVTNIWVNNWYGSSGAIKIASSANSIISGNHVNANANNGIFLNTASNITVSNNVAIGNSSGIAVNNGTGSTFTGNTVQGNASGFNIDGGSSNNTFTGNTLSGNNTRAIYLNNGSANIISGNRLYDNGGATTNNAIYLDASDSNTITGNSITDSSATTTNYAINISNSTSDTNYLADNTFGSGTVNDLGTGTLYGGQSNGTSYLIQPASNITMGSAATVTTLQGNTAVTLNATTGTTIVCQNGTGYLSMCDSSVLTPSAANFIQNSASLQTGANFWIDGVGKVAGGLQSSSLDTISAGTLTLGGTNATSINLAKNVTVAAGRTLTLAGGTTASRPASPTEGTMWFDTTTKQLLVYSNGKWQADSKTATFIVAASDSSQVIKDGAQYVADGTADDVEINAAIAALPSTGGKVYLSEGTYNIAATVNINKANSTVSGAGKATVLKRMYNSTADEGVVSLSGGSDQLLAVYVDGNKASYTATFNQGVRVTGNDKYTVSNNWIVNTAGEGFDTTGYTGDYSLFSDNTVTGTGQVGVHVDNPHNSTIRGNSVYSNGASGIEIGNAANVSIFENIVYSNAGYGIRNGSQVTNNRVYNNTQAGIINATKVTENTVTGNQNGIIYEAGSYINSNYVASNTYSGLVHDHGDIETGPAAIVSNNTIENNGRDGISINNKASKDHIIGNSIANNGGSGADSGIRVSGYSGSIDIQITDNRITDTAGTGYAINIDAGVLRTYLSNNTFSGTGAASINDNGTDTVYANQSRTENGGQLTNRTANDTQAFAVQNAAGTNILAIDTANSKVLVAGTLDTTTATTLNIGSANATAINIGKAGVTTTILGSTAVNPQTSTSTTLLCSNSGVISTCDSSVVAPTGTNFIKNQTGQQASANFNISGTGVASTLQGSTSVQTPLIDTASAGTLTLGGTNATTINLNKGTSLAAGMSLTINGGNTSTRPVGVEGKIYYDTETKQLLIYSNGKWQSDAKTATKIVAASNASQALKDGADYVATGTGDQTVINNALTAAAGGKVYLTEGTYTVNASISIPNNTTLAGAGAGTVIESRSTGANMIVNSDQTTGTGVAVRDMKLDGRLDGGYGGSYGIFIIAGDSTTGLTGASTVENVIVTRFSSHGIAIVGANNTVVNSTSSNNGLAGINVAGVGNVVSGNTLVNNVAGIRASGSSSTGNTITGNTAIGNTTYGIAIINGPFNNTVSNNTIQNTGGATANNGLYLSGTGGALSGNSVTGNVVTDSSATTTNYAININTSANTTYLADNTLGGGTVNDLGTGTIYGGQSNGTTYNIQPAQNITVGSASTTTTLQGNTAVTLNAATGTTMVCRNVSGYLSSCDAGYLAPTATNFIQNQNSAQQATANFWISGAARADTSVLTPSLDTASGIALSIGTGNATGITLGKAGAATTTAGGLLTSSVDTASIAALTIGTTNASSISIGKSSVTTNLSSSTINVGTSGSTTTIAGAAQTTNNTDGNSMTIRGSAGLGTGTGGAVAIQGGNAGATSGANGGNLTLSGGTGSGTGVSGLVIINNATYSTSTTQASAVNANVTQANIDSFGAIILNATGAGVNFTLTSPTLGASAAGRVIYVTAANGSQDFTLRANVGGGTGVEQNIAMRQNTTATMIWNGSQWTAAGASSSTTLQAAYDNTLQSAGGAELVVSKTGTTNGLTIRDSSSAPVNGTLLSIQTKTASTLLSVNSNVTDYATNGGAETAFATDWALIPSSGATVSRNTTAANIAVGTGSVSVTTATSANSGARNTLSAALTPGLRYNVSFTAKLSSGNFVDLNVNYSNDGTNANTACTNYSTQAIATSVWTKVNCTFTAPASTSATNAIFIRQTASGTARTFYVDNLSVTIGADQSYATDGDVNDSANFGSNWQIVTGGGTASATRDTDYGYRASDSAKATISTATAGAGIKNKLSINPLATTPGTLYRITAYASSTTAMTDFTIRYSRDNGTSFDACVDYNTQTLSGSASDFKKITCYVTVSSTAASNAWVFFTQGAGAARSIYVDSFSMTIASNTTPNVQVGGGVTGGPTTLLTLDKGASAPIANDNDALLGSMYYDTTLGKLQCYEADGWGACGSSPDTVVTISPEYTNAVLHGTGVGTMTSDICSDTLNINDATNGPVICGTNETYNFYKWTSPQASPQTYSIYVTYQLPSTFKEFASGQTSLMGRTNNANAAVSYRIFRSDENGLTPCSAAVSVSTGVQTSWQTKVASGAADPSTCGFEPGDSVVFQIDMVASTTANAYVSNLNFVFSNR